MNRSAFDRERCTENDIDLLIKDIISDGSRQVTQNM